MVRKLVIVVFIFTISLFYCGRINTETKNTEDASNAGKIDTSGMAIFYFDTLRNRWYKSIFKTGKPTELTLEELMQIDTLLINCMSDYNQLQEKEYLKYNIDHPDFKRGKEYFLIYLNRYKRQYLPIINSQGEKEVWINCLCSQNGTEEWRKQIVFIEDGGNCFFNAKVNLTTRKCYELIVNH